MNGIVAGFTENNKPAYYQDIWLYNQVYDNTYNFIVAGIWIGIGPKDPPQIDSADFVLQKFKAAQAADMPALLRETNAILSEYVYGGQLPTDTRSFIL